MLSKRVFRFLLLVMVIFCPLIVEGATIEPLNIKQNDLQPHYSVQVKDGYGAAVDIAGSTIYCTMTNIATRVAKISRQTTGINQSDPTNGKFEYRWQTGDTNTTGTYLIEFEINPVSGGKFTLPTKQRAMVVIEADLDSQ